MTATYYRPITVDHTDGTKVGSSNQTNFPMLFSGTYAYLADIAHGGLVTNSPNGYDIGFYSDSAQTTKLSWEIEKYDNTTGQIIAWVKVPTLYGTGAAQDTVIYLTYGNTGITTDQSAPTTTYDASYLGVWHFGTAASLTLLDSKAVNNGTNHSATAVAGQINGGAAFVAGSTQWVSTTTTGFALADASPFTLQCWLNVASSTNLYSLMGTWKDESSGGLAGVNLNLGGLVAHKLGAIIADGSGTNYRAANGSSIVDDSTWRHCAVTYDGSASSAGIKFFVNGIAETNTSFHNTAPGALDNTNFTIGRIPSSVAPQYLTGSLDDVRVSSANRSVDWFFAEYNSQKTGATFYSVGAPSTDTGFQTIVRTAVKRSSYW